MAINLTKNQNELVKFIQKHQPLLQSQIRKRYRKKYASEHSTHKNISRILSHLEEKGVLEKEKIETNKHLKENRWSVL